VVALLHKSEAKTPGADDIIKAGDHIVVIVQQERIKDLLKLTV
jgi:K+/H+ antiporter YhaU regulatory subunit KhtT